MYNQVRSLSQLYKQCNIQPTEDDAEGDDLANFGEYWEFLKPKEVHFWSMKLIPMTHDLCFDVKFKNTEAYLSMTYEERVKNVMEAQESTINIHCVTTQLDVPKSLQYNFTISLNSTEVPFNISALIDSLENTEYSPMIKDLEEKVDSHFFDQFQGQPMSTKKLCAKIRTLFREFDKMKVKLDMQRELMEPSSVSQDIGSLRSRTIRSTKARGKKNPATPSENHRVARGNALVSSTKKKTISESPSPSTAGETSTISALTEVPESLESNRKPDYKQATDAYKNFWKKCIEAFIYGVDKKFELSIDQLVSALAHLNVRVAQEDITKGMMYCLVHLPDRSNRQTLCVMPKGHDQSPGNWESIKDGDFYIINGQDNVAANFMMQKKRLDKNTVNGFQKWNCFIVWTNDNEIIRNISAYFNRVNHFNIFKPSWATNILGARQVWMTMGKPNGIKEATQIRTLVVPRMNKDAHREDKKYKEFVKAVNLRFSQIDVIKCYKVSKGKRAEEALDIHNELKIITSSDETFNLWSKVISNVSNGELLNPDTMETFNDKEGWKPDHGMLNREFFKWLRNLSENDLKNFAEHILNEPDSKRNYAYPKVTLKSISSVLPSCYTVKEWIERRKQKHLLKKELQPLNPDLGLFNIESDLSAAMWSTFKRDYNITKATMNVLLEQLEDEYFAQAKQVRNKNKLITDLSPYTAQFFKVFLEKRKAFTKPAGDAYYRPYSMVSNYHADWPEEAWLKDTTKDLTLGVIDFRNIPGILRKNDSSLTKPYFADFVASLCKRREPNFEEIPVWICMCSDKIEEMQVVQYVENDSILKEYDLQYSDYFPVPNERLGDYAASSVKAKAKVLIIILQNKAIRKRISIPDSFNAPETSVFSKPKKYNELEYRIRNNELRMEFYLWIIKTFCPPKSSLFSVFAGEKITCAALMSNVNNYVLGPSEEKRHWKEISTSALTLDKDDFLPSGYPVDKREFVRIPLKASAVLSSKRKGKNTWESKTLRELDHSYVHSDNVEESNDKDDDDENEEEMEVLPSNPIHGSSTSSAPTTQNLHTRVERGKRRRKESSWEKAIDSIALTVNTLQSQQVEQNKINAQLMEGNMKMQELLFNFIQNQQPAPLALLPPGQKGPPTLMLANRATTSSTSIEASDLATPLPDTLTSSPTSGAARKIVDASAICGTTKPISIPIVEPSTKPLVVSASNLEGRKCYFT